MRKSDLGRGVGKGVFVVEMVLLVRVECGDGWIWEYWECEVNEVELGFECD